MAASAMSFSAACAGARVAGAASSSGSRSRSTAKATMGGRSARVVAVKAASATGARKELAGGLQQSGVARAKRAQRGKVIVESAVPDSYRPGDEGMKLAEADTGPFSLGATMADAFGDPNYKKIRAPLYIRFLCLIPYLIPMMSAIAFTGRAFTVYPLTFKIAITVSPLLQIFYSNSFLPFATFFAIFLGIVRNIKLNHFLRYNAMQAILLDICVMLAGLILSYVPIFLVVTPIGSFLEQMVLCNALFAVGYCMFHCVRGCYPEVPILQEAVYAQVRDVN